MRESAPNMIELSLVKPGLGAVGFYAAALLYFSPVWEWLAMNHSSLAGLAAALNILWGAYRTSVWAYRQHLRRKHAQTHLPNRNRWWLK